MLYFAARLINNNKIMTVVVANKEISQGIDVQVRLARFDGYYCLDSRALNLDDGGDRCVCVYKKSPKYCVNEDRQCKDLLLYLDEEVKEGAVLYRYDEGLDDLVDSGLRIASNSGRYEVRSFDSKQEIRTMVDQISGFLRSVLK